MSLNFTYGEMEAYRVGQIVDMRGSRIVSHSAEGADVAFGKPLAQGSGDGMARLTTVGDTRVLGISVRDRSTSGDVFKAGESIRTLESGPIAVEVATAVAAGDPVHVTVADATFTNAGGLEYPGARYDTSAEAGEIAVVVLK